MVGAQQIDKSARGGYLVRIDLVDCADRDTFTAFDTVIAGSAEIENIFYIFTHYSFLLPLSLRTFIAPLFVVRVTLFDENESPLLRRRQKRVQDDALSSAIVNYTVFEKLFLLSWYLSMYASKSIAILRISSVPVGPALIF